jgi:SSS family solute:Na+ symporter
VVPGVVAFKLFGDVGDAAYGRLVAEVLPPWLSGAFAAMVAAAVITTFSAVLNSTIALWSVDFHERFIGPVANHWRLGAALSVVATLFALLMVPVYAGADSIINLLQQLNGLTSMPVLSAFVAGLLFGGVAARAAIAGVVWGIGLYGLYSFWWQPAGLIGLHYIDMMVVTLVTSVLAALATNRALGGRARWLGLAQFRRAA